MSSVGGTTAGNSITAPRSPLQGARAIASSTGSGDIAILTAVCSERPVRSAKRRAYAARSGAQVPTTAVTGVGSSGIVIPSFVML